MEPLRSFWVNGDWGLSYLIMEANRVNKNQINNLTLHPLLLLQRAQFREPL